MPEEPMFSVIVPAYRARDFITATISSALQNDVPLEVVVVEDGSPDPVRPEDLPHGPVRLIRRDRNGGTARARNDGVSAARGDWIAFLDADDRYESHRLDEVARFISRNDVDAVMTDTLILKTDGGSERVRLRPNSNGLLHIRTPVVFAALVVKRSLLERLGPFDPRWPLHEDMDMWLRLLGNRARVAWLPGADYLYVLNDESKTQAAVPIDGIREFRKIALRHALRGRFRSADRAVLAVRWAKWALVSAKMDTRAITARRGSADRTGLGLRHAMWRSLNRIAKLASRSRITKIRIGDQTLGFRIYSLGNRLLHLRLPETIEANGFTMYHVLPAGRGQWGWQYAFEYEPETCEVFRRLTSPGMTVVDVGAHIGYYTLLAARLVGAGGKVYAFEPDPGYHELLRKNIETNGFGSSVETYRIAVGAGEGEATFFLSESTSGSLFRVRGATGETATVPLTSLDAFFSSRDWPRVDLLKVDIEGAEVLALSGVRGLAERNPDLHLIIEMNPEFLRAAGTSAEELLAAIGGLGVCEVTILDGDVHAYRLPRDAGAVVSAAAGRPVVNLLCTRPSDATARDDGSG